MIVAVAFWLAIAPLVQAAVKGNVMVNYIMSLHQGEKKDRKLVLLPPPPPG